MVDYLRPELFKRSGKAAANNTNSYFFVDKCRGSTICRTEPGEGTDCGIAGDTRIAIDPRIAGDTRIAIDPRIARDPRIAGDLQILFALNPSTNLATFLALTE